MVTRKAIRGVLGNFLGTYMSRYSDCGGYWLFGFIVGDLSELRIDLMALTGSEPVSPFRMAVALAVAKFSEQVHKAGLVRGQIREAWLTIRKMPVPVNGCVNGHPSVGYNMAFSVEVVMDWGRRYEREQIVFVAPHNAKVEWQSVRAESPSAAI